ncbi:MAG TPA: hypothetical protein DIT04_12140 [Dysgonomonas sp.]|nr:hypothetical protein [Dysgonomonas sp.]
MLRESVETKPKTESILEIIRELESATGVKRTLLAVCPNSMSVIKASLRAAKRNNAPIKYAATLNQIDGDGGYTGLTQKQFTKMLEIEASRINYKGQYIVAIDHGGPWLKDIQAKEKWDIDKAMNGVKKSFEDAVLAGYDLLHVDPTVDIHIEKDSVIDIRVVASRTVELIAHVEKFRKQNNLPAISYEVGTEEVEGGLADEKTFDLFLELLRDGLKNAGLQKVWPCFIVGKVGTDLHTIVFDKEVARKLTAKAAKYGSFIKGHYTDAVENPYDYPLCGIGAANVGPEFTISEYKALMELEELERIYHTEGKVAALSNIQAELKQAVIDSNRWQKWLKAGEKGKQLHELAPERQEWIIQTCCRYIYQNPEIIAARLRLYENLGNLGIDAEEIVLSTIERDMDKYFNAFNLVNLNNYL